MTGHHSFGQSLVRIQIALVLWPLTNNTTNCFCVFGPHSAQQFVQIVFTQKSIFTGESRCVAARVESFVCHLWQPLILHFCCTIYSLCGMTSTSAFFHSLTGIFVGKLIAQIVLNVLLQAASSELDKQRAF